MNQPKSIHLIHLLPKIDDLLITFLEGLSIDDWKRQTLAPEWKVKDVAVHLLDGNLRTLSMLRDNFYGEVAGPIDSYQDMVKFLNQLNADWVKATRRLSPQVIIELLKTSGKEYCDYLKTLNPEGTAEFSVGWAGEEESKNWFHIAREYTEKWHHQQQIRFAIGEDKELLGEEWYLPYLDTSVRALPYHYRDVQGQEGDLIKLVFLGKRDKNWFLIKDGNWKLLTETDKDPTCEARIDDEYAWRIFTKGISKEEAISKATIIGKKEIGLKIFDLIAVMA